MTRRDSSTTVTPILVLPAIQRRRRVARCVALLAVLFAAPARADVLVDFDFQFTPRNHPTTPTATMPGWGSAVIRLFSTSGPILSVDFETPISPEISRGIYEGE